MRVEKKEVSVVMEYEFSLCGSLPAMAVIGPQKVAMKARNDNRRRHQPPMMQMQTSFHVLILVEIVDESPWDLPS